MVKELIFLLLLITTNLGFGQGQSIEGTLVDDSKKPVFSATVVLISSVDSSIVKGTTTNIDGCFKLNAFNKGLYSVKISFVGYETLVIPLAVLDSSIALGELVLINLDTKLKEVKIAVAATPVVQLGDTTQINANAFKTNPDATIEDLVTKMPGITLQNGELQAQGEKVKKVLVDGKEYFGDDASAVLKNLPAEVVDKIQIFDRQSDQSQLTGFDDGESYKTINIVTKQEYKDGVFGKGYAGFGPDNKWNGGLNVTLFSDKRRIGILGNSNNVNNQNFSADDLSGVTSGKGGKSGSDFLVNSKNGITTTNAFGINYDEKFKTLSVNGSYFFNRAKNNAINTVFRQYYSNDTNALAYQENENNTNSSNNHKLNFSLSWKIDSVNTLKIQPKITLQQSGSTSLLSGLNSQSNAPINLLNNIFNSDGNGFSIGAPILYKHSFAKKGRTISLNLAPNYSKNYSVSKNSSYTFVYEDNSYQDSIELIKDQSNNGFSMNSGISYTEPLTQKSQLMISYKNKFSQNYSNKAVFNYSPIEESYNQFDSTLSNQYRNNYLANSLGVNYKINQLKLNVTFGADYQIAQLVGAQTFPNSVAVNRVFHNLLPNARFQYKFSKTKNIRLNYRSQNTVPSVTQLQNVINNNNPLQLSTGNPNLKQDWQNTLSLQYSAVNTPKLTSFFSLLSGSIIKNYIVKNTFIATADTIIAPGIELSRGGRLSTPTNSNGYVTIRNFNNYGVALKKIKSNLSLNLGASFTRTPGIINEVTNFSNAFNTGLGVSLTSNFSEKIDVSLSSNTTYNTIENSLNTNLNTSYYNQKSAFKFQMYIKKKIVVQTELYHQFNSGLSSNYNQNFVLLNAYVALKLFKTNLGELRLSAFDIFNQNTNIYRNITETYYEDVQNNVLNRYFLATFTYTIKYFKNQKSDSN